MSIRQVRLMVEELPRGLAEQIIGYAESVERSLPEIFREARRAFRKDTADKVVFIAGVKKLQWLVSSSYWTLDNSGKLLRELDVENIRIGGADVSRGGQIHQQLQSLLEELERVLRENNFSEYIQESWPEIIKKLSGNGRRRNQ